MPVRPTYPGVYIQEVPSGVRTITGVSTSIAMFIGMTKRGRLKAPTRVLSFSDYERAFGSETTISEMTDQVRQFFLNGGQQAFIMRIAKGAEAATVALKDELSDKEVLKISARDAGVDGNAIFLAIDYNTPTPESTFNVRVFRRIPDGRGGLSESNQEVFRNLNMNPKSGNFAVDAITQRSLLITAERGDHFEDATVTAFQGYALCGRLFDDDAELKTAIDDAIEKTGPGGVGGTLGQFRVSVNGNPFIQVTIQKTDISSTSPSADLASAINNALSLIPQAGTVGGALVQGPGSKRYLQIKSTAVGGSVAFRSATTNDISPLLELGLERGGFEVDGHARRRPAPTGLFFRLGSFDPGASEPVIKALTDLADQDQSDIEEYELADNAGTHTFSVNLGSGGKIYEKAGENPSLRHVRERLKAFAARINADAAGDPNFAWSGEVHGHRLVLTTGLGDANNKAASFTTRTRHDLGAAGNGLDKPNSRYYSLGDTGDPTYQAPGTKGFDGLIPQSPDYSEALEIIDREVDLFNLLVLPRASGQTDTQREAVWGPASNFCLNRRAFLIMDPRSDGGDWATVNEVESEIENLRVGLVKDHAAIYWPRVRISINGSTKVIDPSGSIAGLMARIDANRGVWKAPAGIEADIRGIRSVEHMMSDLENGSINPQAVNAIRVFPNGIVSWGARTMDGFDDSGNLDYKYVPVRRLALFIEESLYRGTQWVVFEPNDEPLWAQIRLNVGAFMHTLFRQGAFAGRTPREAYFVKCDKETTTQDDINKGIVNILVGFAPLKPAEFVIIKIQQLAGEIAA